MRAHEFVIEVSQSRRGFLSNLVGAGALAAGGAAGVGIRSALKSQPADSGSVSGTVVQPAQQTTVAPESPPQRPRQSTVSAQSVPFKPADYRDLLIKIAKQSGINTSETLSSFLGQCEVETDKWRAALENFNYTSAKRLHSTYTTNFPTVDIAKRYVERGDPAAIANRALANKNGNGNEASGDGWRYRGRGFMQLTGRENYAKAGAAIHPDNPNIYVNNPDLLSSNPVESAKVSVWYYIKRVGVSKRGEDVTKKVNPALLKRDERNAAMSRIERELRK